MLFQSPRTIRFLFYLTISFTLARAAFAVSLSSIKTVFVIVMENHNWDIIKDSEECPFINKTLLPSAAYSPNYFSPAGVHPSEPNYIWMEAGTNFGIYDDGMHTVDSTNHLTTLLDRAGISWRSYQESMAGDVYPIVDHYPFAIRHCPQLHFQDVVSDPVYCLQHVRPYSEFEYDLNQNRVARYNFITPNLTNDMHDLAFGRTSARASGDFWLSHEVPKILASNAYLDNGALLITWDEGTSFTDGPMAMIVCSPLGKGGGYYNAIPYTHSATLRTLQNIFQVRPFLGDAINGPDLSDLFDLFTVNATFSTDLKKVVLSISGLQSGQEVSIHGSQDLSTWTTQSTHIADSNRLMLTIDLADAGQQYYRASVQP